MGMARYGRIERRGNAAAADWNRLEPNVADDSMTIYGHARILSRPLPSFSFRRAQLSCWLTLV